MARETKIRLLLVLVIYMFGCGLPPAEYFKFKKLSEEKQHEEFRKFPIEKQVDFYLYGMSREPPDYGFAEDIASRGTEVIPYLLDRIRKEEDYRKADLIYVFEVMNRSYVDLNKDKGLMDTLDEIVAKMNDPDWRRMSEKSVKAIKETQTRPRSNTAAPNNSFNRSAD